MNSSAIRWPFSPKLSMTLNSREVAVEICMNKQADDVYKKNYWLKRVRRSRRISYVATYRGKEVAWVQCADPFGTKLAKPLQIFFINDAVELCRGYFIDDTPSNMESCVISKVLRRIANDWYKRFKVIKKIATVYQNLDADQQGVVYKASGFRPYAKCARARHFLMPARGDSKGKMIIWARALRPISGAHYDICMPKNWISGRDLTNFMQEV